MSFSVSERVGKMCDPYSLIGCGEIGSDSWQSSFGFAPWAGRIGDALDTRRHIAVV